MKKLLYLLCILPLVTLGQLNPGTLSRVPIRATVLGVNFPAGNLVSTGDSSKLFLSMEGVTNSESITTAPAKFKEISSKWYRQGGVLSPEILTDKVSIGDRAAADQLQITNNFRLPVTTGETVGVIKKAADWFIHDYGLYNTFLGINAGNFSLTGTANTGIGESTLYKNAGGYDNTAVGYKALYSNTGGFANTAFGATALYTNTSGTYNTGLGNHSLENNTTGSGNIGVGDNALYYNSTGTRNTAIGYRAAWGNSTGSYNSVVGNNSFVNSTTGSYNSVVGNEAMYYTNTGRDNVAMGHRALYSNTVGFRNVAIGDSAFYDGTNYSNSIAIGFRAQPSTSNQAVFGNTDITSTILRGTINAAGTPDGTASKAIGIDASGNYIKYNKPTIPTNYWSLEGNHIYNNNPGGAGTGYVGIGLTTPTERLEVSGNIEISQTLGSDYGNIKIGGSRVFHLYGDQNLFIGWLPGNYDLTGGKNIGLGGAALQNLSSGSYNTTIGVYSQDALTTGLYNTSTGYASLSSTTSGSGNTAIGSRALYGNVTGTHNTAIGDSAFLSTSNYVNSTAIGYNAQPTASNQVIIGDANVTSTILRGVINAAGTNTGTPSTTLGLDASNNIIKYTNPTGGSGSTTVSNLTGGDGLVYKSMTGTQINLRSIKEGTGIDVSTKDDTITIRNTAPEVHLGDVTSVAGTWPLYVTGTTAPTININQASSTDSGYVTNTKFNDWDAKIGGSGTAGYVPRFITDTKTLTNSLIRDGGSSIGVGTAPSPYYYFKVNGDGYFRTALEVASTSTASLNISTTNSGGAQYPARITIANGYGSNSGLYSDIRHQAISNNPISWYTGLQGNYKYTFAVQDPLNVKRVKLSIDTTGNMVLGTASAQAEKLYVQGRLKVTDIPLRANQPTYGYADSAGLLVKYPWPTISGSYVTSVGATSPLQSSGGTTPTISFKADSLSVWYTKMNQGATAYGWGNHASQGYHTGNGTSGKIAKYTGTSTLGSSILTEYTGRVDIDGTMSISSTYKFPTTGGAANDVMIYPSSGPSPVSLTWGKPWQSEGYVTGTPWRSEGYITDGNTNWDNSYGFITASQADTGFFNRDNNGRITPKGANDTVKSNLSTSFIRLNNPSISSIVNDFYDNGSLSDSHILMSAPAGSGVFAMVNWSSPGTDTSEVDLVLSDTKKLYIDIKHNGDYTGRFLFDENGFYPENEYTGTITATLGKTTRRWADSYLSALHLTPTTASGEADSAWTKESSTSDKLVYKKVKQGISGTVTVSQGGTGITSLTPYGIMIGGTTATGTVQSVGTGSDGQHLRSNGSSAAPSWEYPVVRGTFCDLLTANTTDSIARFDISGGFIGGAIKYTVVVVAQGEGGTVYQVLTATANYSGRNDSEGFGMTFNIDTEIKNLASGTLTVDWNTDKWGDNITLICTASTSLEPDNIYIYYNFIPNIGQPEIINPSGCD